VPLLQREYGTALLKAKAYPEAETQLLAYVNHVDTIHAARNSVPSSTTYARALQTLIELYTAWDKPEQAAEWKKKRNPPK